MEYQISRWFRFLASYIYERIGLTVTNIRAQRDVERHMMNNLPAITPTLFLRTFADQCSCGHTVMVIQSDWTYVCEACARPWEATYTHDPLDAALCRQ